MKKESMILVGAIVATILILASLAFANFVESTATVYNERPVICGVAANWIEKGLTIIYSDEGVCPSYDRLSAFAVDSTWYKYDNKVGHFATKDFSYIWTVRGQRGVLHFEGEYK